MSGKHCKQSLPLTDTSVIGIRPYTVSNTTDTRVIMVNNKLLQFQSEFYQLWFSFSDLSL